MKEISEQSLELKYRPRKLDDIVGNKGLIESLKTVLSRDNDKRKHSLLFQGPSGCGKTTLTKNYLF